MPQKWGRDTKVKILGAEIVFKVSGEQTADAYIKDLQEIGHRAKNMKPANEKVLAYLQRSTARTFKAEGRPTKWKPLAPSTIKERIRKGYGPGPILVRSGKLMKSLTQSNAPGAIAKATPRTIQYGSRVPYFRYHQERTRNIPQRIMLLLQRQDRAQVSRIYNTWVREGTV